MHYQHLIIRKKIKFKQSFKKLLIDIKPCLLEKLNHLSIIMMSIISIKELLGIGIIPLKRLNKKHYFRLNFLTMPKICNLKFIIE